MTVKARLISVQVSFQFVADDGHALDPISVNPVIFTARNIGNIPRGVDDVIAQLQAQLDAQQPQTPPPPGAAD